MSRAFRERVLTEVPACRTDPGVMGVVAHVLAPSARDRDTGRPLLAHGLLAEFDGARAQYLARNYRSGDLLRRVAEAVPGFAWSGPEWSPGREARCRQVVSPGLSERLLTEANLESKKSVPEIEDPVDLATGEPYGPRLRRRERDRALDVAIAEAEGVAASGAVVRDETLAVCRSMNALPANLFTRAVTRNGEAAWEVARSTNGGGRREHAVAVLRSVEVQPQPFYRPGRKTARAVAHGPSPLALPREVRAALFEGWVQIDLKAAQLAYAASAWPVPEAESFLSGGGDVWDLLVGALAGPSVPERGVPEWTALKAVAKGSLYSLVFGMGKRNLRRLGGDDEGGEKRRLVVRDVLGVEPGEAARRLLRVPVIAAMLEAREHRLGAITEAGGARDCFGHWLPSTGRHGARSVLAQLAQAAELQMMLPLVRAADAEAARASEAGRSPEWRLAAWLHDGAWVACSNRTKRDRVVARLKTLIDDHCHRLGYPTWAEVST